MRLSGTSSVQSSSRIRLAWRIGPAILLLALAMISVDFIATVYGKYRQLDSAVYTMFWTRRAWLWIHLAGGAVTILLGLVQFLNQWPFPFPRLHRWTGRIYMIGMLVACVGATGLLATSPAPIAIRIAFAATALAWLSTAFAGSVAIHSGRVWLHRRWMVRNYLVTLSPITFRALAVLPDLMSLAPPSIMIPILLWASWLVPLLICELVCRIVDRAGLRPDSSLKPTPLRGAA